MCVFSSPFIPFYTKIISNITTKSPRNLLQTAQKLAIINAWEGGGAARGPAKYRCAGVFRPRAAGAARKGGMALAAQDRRTFAIILAAGDGKRMKSDRPKVLCEVLFQPMIRWVENAVRDAGIDDITIVTGEGAKLVEAAVSPGCKFVCQRERRGTGHAVMAAADALAAGGDALVLYGDAPFIEGGAITAALRQHRAEQNAVTLVSARPADPFGYGRVLRGTDGGVRAVVEERDCDEATRAITEINAGVYWFDAAFLAGALEKLTPPNAQGEYYLTDVPAIAAAEGRRVGAWFCEDAQIVLGANDRRQLLALNTLARERMLLRHLDNGVDIPCADGILIGAQVEIGRDARILPGTVLEGRTVIGPGCVIGPNSYIKDSTVGAGTRVLASYLTDSTVGEGTRIGPFTQLRPDSHIGDGVKIGDFVEVKNATVGDGTSIAHLTYIGDSDVGRYCNFGCGVVTANYDGKKKFRTTVGDRAFIGCNTNLIPPVRIGEGAYTAAGTTVDSDVPAGALAIGRVRQEIKEGWSDDNIAFKADKK